MKGVVPAEVVLAFVNKLGGSLKVSDEVTTALEQVYNDGREAEKRHIFEMFRQYAVQHQDPQVRHAIANALCMLI
jgi:hypothetical protein